MTTISEPRSQAVAGMRERAARARVRIARLGGEQLALSVLLLVTAAAYLWGLSRNGYANEYYAAAVQAGSESWKAWFFGSFDAASFITVDKTPAALWVMGLSGRIFGFSTWSMLVPEALMGVASVAFLYAAVRRWFSAGAAILAGVVLAVTPVAVLMFRFNNPDALLVLLLVAGAWAVTRAIDSVRRPGWWMALAGVLVGLGFLTKMLQAFLVLPGFGLAYLVAGRPVLAARIRHCLGALVAMIAGAGWWIAVVELMPASARPYIGGSQTNSILELTLGYNGLGRLTGNETGSVGGRGGWGGDTGLPRLFTGEMGSQISWLLPAASIALLVLAAVAGRAPRTDRTRAFAVLWGGWLVVTGLVFSYMQGIIHSYYMIALAPAVGALVGAAAVTLWRRRTELLPRTALAGTTMLTAGWSFWLLAQAPDWYPVVRYAVLVAGLVGALGVLIVPSLPAAAAIGSRAARPFAVVAAALVVVAGLLGPAAYSLETISVAHAGALPSAGPAGQGGIGRTGGSIGGGPIGGGPGGGGPIGGGPGGGGPGGGGAAGGAGGGGGGAGGGGAGGRGAAGGGAGGFLGGGGIGGVSADLVTLLRQAGSGYVWVAAAVTANGAAPLQIASGVPVMAIGGFNGTDPAPSLTAFQQLVAEGQVRYFIASGGGGRGGPGGNGTSSEISTWVQNTYESATVGGFTVYDLAAG